MAETQPALATTKRKFHRIMENIAANTSTTSVASSLQASNASTTSLAYPATPEPPNKRPRSSNANEERERSISASQARIQALKDQLLTPRREGTVRAVGKSIAPKASTPRKQPNFQPYSQEQFLQRLKTFADVKKWTSKPDAIGEVEWAKRGWTCDTWNTVACKGGCEKRVAVKLRPKRKDVDGKDVAMTEDLGADVDARLVEKFRELIQTGHAEDCLWRKRGCHGDVYHISIASRVQASAELLARYQSLKSLSDDLPLLEHIAYPDPSIDNILQRTPVSLFKSGGTDNTVTTPSTPTEEVAFALALFGWSGLSESRISLATCDHCFQRIGLWLSSEARLKDMSTKLDVPIESLRLNLLESHREHCPWKNADAQSNSSEGPIANMPAWQTLQFILLGKPNESPKKSQHTRNVESVDIGSNVDYPRGSLDSQHEDNEKGGETTASMQDKWKRFKAKLRRTTSKKSLKSLKSVKSSKSTTTLGKGKDAEKP